MNLRSSKVLSESFLEHAQSLLTFPIYAVVFNVLDFKVWLPK